MKTLLIATHNTHKLREIREVLAGYPLTIISLNELPRAVPDIPETGVTFRENAVLKATETARQAQHLTLSDDSGLCIDALGGKPGVLSARFAGAGKDDAKNRKKVLNLMLPYSDNERQAHFVCAVALAEPDKLIGVVEGKCTGCITREERGTNGFGYDSLFYYPPLQKTFAELNPLEKNKVSHRAQALRNIKQVLDAYLASGKKDLKK